MAASESVNWDVCERCAEDGGVGIRLPSGGKCWVHADSQDLDAALKRLGEDGRIDVRGVTLDAELLARILAAAPQEAGRTALEEAVFLACRTLWYPTSDRKATPAGRTRAPSGRGPIPWPWTPRSTTSRRVGCWPADRGRRLDPRRRLRARGELA